MIKQVNEQDRIVSGIVTGFSERIGKTVVTSMVQSTINHSSLDMVAIELDFEELTQLIDELEVLRRKTIDHERGW